MCERALRPLRLTVLTFRRILVFPRGGPGALNISLGDLRRLTPGEFLNDTIIEFGLKYWLSYLRGMNPEVADSIHVFSSFFYKKLNQKKCVRARPQCYGGANAVIVALKRATRVYASGRTRWISSRRSTLLYR
ncbi:hypothetical protein AURDEDRAFT_75247 [Auricularia subglabra TFB-10046 SS5]|uniref:Ubiquitin-like protease family profile domain-containing protein n=1 Tax=Auricularia subglabra (strain TFB-10046 / SS5) TaxID=717982 RepID=J0CXJ9_AURST|nr:hypothetical protein AURDEDRAFT_75247 [Auricularia subglabra TFB-10046 SS5]